jgi:hypothetical protein
MRRGFLAALTVLLAGHGLAFAQQFGSSSVGHSWGVTGPPPAPRSPPNNFIPDPVSGEPLPPTAARSSAIGDEILPRGDLPDQAPAQADGDTQARPFGFRASGEYLLWWIKNGRVPPLVTVGGNGVPGSPGTRILVDNLDFDDDFRPSGRFALGYRFETVPNIGIEANYFFLSAWQTNECFASSGDPALGRPYINVATGRPAATLAASPGVAAGTVTLGARTSLWGAEANLTARLICSDTFHLAALAGFRFLRFEDELRIDERFQVAPNVPGFGGSKVSLPDDFLTVNRFYGGQAGLEAGVQRGLLTIDFRGKIGLGQMQEVASVNGATNVLGPTGSRTLFQGGLLALRSNIGCHQRDELAFLPEVGLNVGLQLTRHLKVYAGYSLLWVSTVARAGEQIDPVVNVTQFPILSGNGPLVGPARPAFHFAATDFWA